MIYHVFNKSISRFKIFNSRADFSRIISVIRYYQQQNPAVKFSKFIRYRKNETNLINDKLTSLSEKSKLVEIIAYCIMPTHLHLILEQQAKKGTTIYVSNILNSYTRYFNIKHNRKGPLWESNYKKILIETDEQLLHLTRYIHLNPVTAYLVNKPEEWSYSSYDEYIAKFQNNRKFCKYAEILDIDPREYKKFVKDGVGYQRELAQIKKLILD